MSSIGRLTIAIVLLVTVAFVASPAAAAAPDQQAEAIGSASFQQDQPDNASSPHEHPDEAGEDGDLEALSGWLANELSQSLGDSTVQISEGEYEQARELLGDDYDDRLDQYVEVAGETGSESDEEAAEEFRDARDNQREFIDAAQEYEETYTEYREAKEQGDEQRARELARDLEEYAQAASRNASDLEENYQELGDQTGQDFDEEREVISETREDIDEQQEEVRQEEFFETEMTASVSDERFSFRDPLVITGQVISEEGEPVANGTVEIIHEERAITTRTDANGEYTLEYRPTTLRLAANEIEVRYVPGTETAYLGTNESVAASVDQVEPTVTITDSPETVAFNETVTVTGTVGVDGIGADGVPVTVSIGGEHVGEVRTDADGTFELTTQVPADASPGEEEIRAAVAQQDRALARATTTASVEVETTPAILTLNAEAADENEIRVSGTLTAEDGTAAAGQPVQIRIDGTTIGTAESNENGAYETTVTVPDSVRTGEREDVEVVAVYANPDGNLEDDQASTVVTVATVAPDQGVLETLVALLGGNADLGTGIGGTISSLSWWHWLAIGLLAVLSGVGVYRFVRRAGWFSSEEGSEIEEGTTVQDIDGTEVTTDNGIDPIVSLLTSAHEFQADDPDRAIERAYAAVRHHLTDHVRETARTRTHWEFYSACRTNGLADAEVETLRALTERYEQAAFAPKSTSAADAEAAILEAEEVVGVP